MSKMSLTTKDMKLITDLINNVIAYAPNLSDVKREQLVSIREKIVPETRIRKPRELKSIEPMPTVPELFTIDVIRKLPRAERKKALRTYYRWKDKQKEVDKKMITAQINKVINFKLRQDPEYVEKEKADRKKWHEHEKKQKAKWDKEQNKLRRRLMRESLKAMAVSKEAYAKAKRKEMKQLNAMLKKIEDHPDDYWRKKHND